MRKRKTVVRHKILKTKTKRSSYFFRFAEAITPREELSLSQFSDEERILPRGASFESGQWRTDRFPFLREIMDYCTKRLKTKLRVVQKGSQVGFTEVLINFMFYKIKHKPGPVLYIQKTLDAIAKFQKQRWDKSIEEMKSIKKLIRKKNKTGGSTAKVKTYPGGMLVFGGANSAASLRSMPIECFIVDEEDSFETDIGGEGSPEKLGEVRTRNYPYGIILRGSSPTLKETSTIEPAFLAGDQRRYMIPCPYCKELDYLRMDRLKWDGGDASTVMLVCEKCGALIEERYKVWMFAEENGARWVPQNPKGKYPSWHLPAFYSPLGFYSWEELVQEWIEANEDPTKAKLKVFINTVLGETYVQTGKQVEPTLLERRKEKYLSEVPTGGRILAAGFDIQENRIEGEIIAWGSNEECWSIDYVVFMGDTALPAVWSELDEFIMKKSYRHSSGAMMIPAIIGMDCGHRTEQVYKYCKFRESRRVYAIKGDDGWGHGFIDRPLKKNKHGVYMFRAFVDELKSKIYSHLAILEPGPGYCHFPDKPVYNSKYFSMLTAEQLHPVKRGNKTVLQWELPVGRRNEALDARCYAIAALNILGPTLKSVEEGKTFYGVRQRPVNTTQKQPQSRRQPVSGNFRRRGRKVFSKGIQH